MTTEAITMSMTSQYESDFLQRKKKEFCLVEMQICTNRQRQSTLGVKGVEMSLRFIFISLRVKFSLMCFGKYCFLASWFLCFSFLVLA